MDALADLCWQHRSSPATSSRVVTAHAASRLPVLGPSARRTNHCLLPRTRRRCRGLAAGKALQVRSGSSSSNASTAEPDINQLTTALNNAIAAEDYALAAQLRDQLRAASGDGAEAAADWYRLGILDWLADRAERVGYRFPTEVQKRATRVVRSGADAIIQSVTGSGKTMAFLMPLLSALVYPPQAYPESFLGPQLVVVVPTRELGVQIVMLVYKLFGGSVHAGIPGDPTNMFSYRGPPGIRVKGCLDKEEVLRSKNNGWLFATSVVVGTPECLAELCTEPCAVRLTACLRAIAVDEVDAYSPDQYESLEFLLTEACREQQLQQQQRRQQQAQQQQQERQQQQSSAEGEEQRQEGDGARGQGRSKPQLVLVGATPAADSLVERYVQQGWLRDPVTLRVGPQGRVPAGLQHRYIVVEEGRKLIVACRQLRLDLQRQGQDAAPARVILFVRDEAAARAAAVPLRSGLWGEHTLSVLLPGGEEPIQALHAFRDNQATFLLATPAAARGLDLPAVSHVYSLDPPGDAVGYLHRAGRAGRVGSSVRGTVTMLVAPEQREQLLAIAAELGLDMREEPEPAAELALDAEGNVDDTKRALDDLFNLL